MFYAHKQQRATENTPSQHPIKIKIGSVCVCVCVCVCRDDRLPGEEQLPL